MSSQHPTNAPRYYRDLEIQVAKERAEIAALQKKCDGLEKQCATLLALYKTSRKVDVPTESLMMLVKAALEVGEISYARAAELLSISVLTIRELGWGQGPGLAEVLRDHHAMERLRHGGSCRLSNKANQGYWWFYTEDSVVQSGDPAMAIMSAK